MATIPAEEATELLKKSVGLRQAWLAAGLADMTAVLAQNRRMVRKHDRLSDAVNEASFGVKAESPSDDAEEEMIVINVGDTTVTYPQPQSPQSVSTATPTSTPSATIAKPVGEALKPIGTVAKVLLGTALLGGTGGAGFWLANVLNQAKPAAVDTDTSSEFILLPDEVQTQDRR